MHKAFIQRGQQVSYSVGFVFENTYVKPTSGIRFY